MLIRLKILLLLFMLDSTFVLANNNCQISTSQVDLRSQMGPVRDQDDIGWCFGFAAADLLTHYLLKTKAAEVKNPDKKANFLNQKYAVSGVGIAEIFNKTYHSDHLKGTNGISSEEIKKLYKKEVVAEGGNILLAIESAKKNGFCFEKDLPSENFSYVKDNLCGYDNKCSLVEILDLVYDKAGERNCGFVLTQIQKLVPTLSINQINSILLYSKKQDAISRLVNISCHEKFKTRFFSPNRPVTNFLILKAAKNNHFLKNDEAVKANNLIERLDSVLEKGTPVGISYNASFLLSTNPSTALSHASSIVGKRLNPKTCEIEYILRNSWGTSCNIYKMLNPDFSKCTSKFPSTKDQEKIYSQNKACLKEYPLIFRNPRVDCDQKTGYVFIKKDDLLKNIKSISYLDE